MNHGKFSMNVIRVSLAETGQCSIIYCFIKIGFFVKRKRERERGERERKRGWGKRLFCFIYIKYFT